MTDVYQISHVKVIQNFEMFYYGVPSVSDMYFSMYYSKKR